MPPSGALAPPPGRVHGRSQAAAALANRDFRLLFASRSVSLIGDGAFLVALAWQVYTIDGSPAALAVLGVAMTTPLVLLLAFGGIVSDRCDRRRVMMRADLARAALLAALFALSATGSLRIWMMACLIACYGAAQAFFDPASDAVLPEILPAQQLGPANAIEQIVRPMALRLIGPAVGGLALSVAGPGTVFLADAASFLVSAGALRSMTPVVTAAAGAPDTQAASLSRDLREGFGYVRGHVWLWGTFACAGIAYLLFMGPVEVLVPYVVKHILRGSGLQLGLVLGAGGAGSVLCAVCMLGGRLPGRPLAFTYGVWAAATLAVAGYGVAERIWQLMLAALVFGVLETAGAVVWATVKQRAVPVALLGRVSSFDWLISAGLLPLSFALTSPASALLGARETLVLAGVVGAAVTAAGLMLPGMMRAERELVTAVLAGAGG
jgi:hypothetical protein